MTDGYIYCFSNPCMPGILKVGMTERTPVIRLGEANASDTWRPPTPYKIEFSKKVSDASGKEKTLHTLLEQYTERINPRREFFRAMSLISFWIRLAAIFTFTIEGENGLNFFY